MAIRILVNGAHGKMGQECVKAIQSDPELQLIGQTSKDNDLGIIIKTNNAQVVVDFTLPQVAYDNARAIINANAHPVIGTTGITTEQIIELKQQCAQKKLGGIIAPNFSIGAILMMQFAKTAAKFLPDVEIIELHHAGKIDSPSGTALKTAELIAEGRTTVPKLKSSREIIPGARGATSHDIPIHAVRLPGFVASQEVLFGGLGETLSIRHDTIHREAFMPGVLLACKKVVHLDGLVYGLENLL